MKKKYAVIVIFLLTTVFVYGGMYGKIGASFTDGSNKPGYSFGAGFNFGSNRVFVPFMELAMQRKVTWGVFQETALSIGLAARVPIYNVSPFFTIGYEAALIDRGFNSGGRFDHGVVLGFGVLREWERNYSGIELRWRLYGNYVQDIAMQRGRINTFTVSFVFGFR